MKKTINGKRYDSERCEVLGKDEHMHNGLCSGVTRLLRAADGELLVHTDSNGQDCHLFSCMVKFEDSAWTIDDFDLDDEQEKRCAELGLIEIV